MQGAKALFSEMHDKAVEYGIITSLNKRKKSAFLHGTKAKNMSNNIIDKFFIFLGIQNVMN